MTEKFISVSDFVDYLGTLPKEVRATIFKYLKARDICDDIKSKAKGMCRVIEVHTNIVAKENEELAAEIAEEN